MPRIIARRSPAFILPAAAICPASDCRGRRAAALRPPTAAPPALRRRARRSRSCTAGSQGASGGACFSRLRKACIAASVLPSSASAQRQEEFRLRIRRASVSARGGRRRRRRRSPGRRSPSPAPRRGPPRGLPSSRAAGWRCHRRSPHPGRGRCGSRSAPARPSRGRRRDWRADAFRPCRPGRASAGSPPGPGFAGSERRRGQARVAEPEIGAEGECRERARRRAPRRPCAGAPRGRRLLRAPFLGRRLEQAPGDLGARALGLVGGEAAAGDVALQLGELVAVDGRVMGGRAGGRRARRGQRTEDNRRDKSRQDRCEYPEDHCGLNSRTGEDHQTKSTRRRVADRSRHTIGLRRPPLTQGRPGAVLVPARGAARLLRRSVDRHRVGVLAAVLRADLVGRRGDDRAGDVSVRVLPCDRLAARGLLQGPVLGLERQLPVRPRQLGADLPADDAAVATP